MSELIITSHAETRLAQRAIRMNDVELITLLGVEVADGYLVLDKQCSEFERDLRCLIGRVNKIRGKRLVIKNGRLITGYHSSKPRPKRIIKFADE